MQLRKIALSLALALGTLAPAEAATFKISFDQSSTGAGDDWFGTFKAPAAGGWLTSFTATINGVVFDTLFYRSYPRTTTLLFPLYDATGNFLAGVGWPITTFTPDAAGSSDQAALLVGLISNQRLWGVGTCTASKSCNAVVAGTYSISAVPVPAALPMLASAVAGMGFVARRRKQKRA